MSLKAKRCQTLLLRDVKQVGIDAFLLVGEHMWTSLGSVDLSGDLIACNLEQVLLRTEKLMLQSKTGNTMPLLSGE